MDKKPVFIGGIVFDGDEDELKAEMARLKKYFEGVCGAVDACYPKDLHCAIQGERNNETVGKVKQELNRTLPKFFGDKNRRGKYHIFAMLRGENRDGGGCGNSAGEAVREDLEEMPMQVAQLARTAIGIA